MRRNEIRWERWQAAVAAGEKPSEFLPRLTDAALVQLLAGADRSAKYECDIICTELLNRFQRLRVALGEVAHAADHFIDAAIHEAEVASAAIDRTVEALDEHLEVRNDQIGDEPETALAASEATGRVVSTLEQAEATRRRLNELAEDVEARADSS